ncbi:MAG: hypothetical protein LBC55_09715, partial [Desulfovibrio sp.]|nr:hypothetical protein [Desulfovibrio sp.]
MASALQDNGNFRFCRGLNFGAVPYRAKRVKRVGNLFHPGEALSLNIFSQAMSAAAGHVSPRTFRLKKKPRMERGFALLPATECRFASAETMRAHKVTAPREPFSGTGDYRLPSLKKVVNNRAPQTVFLQKVRAAACALALCAFLQASAPASARVVGTEGNVYPIHEIDLTKLIAARSGEFDFEKYAESNKRQLEDRVRSFRPVDAVADLPVANISAAYKIDPTYTLPYDIRDAQGEIVYPKGYEFNPLEAMSKQGLSIRTPYVIINAERPEEMRWLERKVGKSARGTFVLLITNGLAYELSERFG